MKLIDLFVINYKFDLYVMYQIYTLYFYILSMYIYIYFNLVINQVCEY